MAVLPVELRKTLEKGVITARETAEEAAHAALDRLALNEANPYGSMDEEARRLRRVLRERARALGDGSVEKGLSGLVEEVAYEQWHRMLFARFLAENDLLMHPEGVSVSLADCEELAREERTPGIDGWDVAARYAAGMLPGIFRADDPAVRVRFAAEGRAALERLLDELPATIFRADDALGWIYQFWQTKSKEEVNRSGRKIGGQDIAPVTQLFTEHYMVQFLLENSLGAWWAARHPDSPLVNTFQYLRFRDDGSPAAGTFPGWPARVAEVTVMDPCSGSCHFLVAAFEMLRHMRMEEEGIDGARAGDAVLRDNLFGLEIDPRCTQLGAFALAFAAWKAGGYRPLPVPNVACSGIPVAGQLSEWKRLAGGDLRLETTLERLYHLFRNAPDIGSLIDPLSVPARERLFAADYAEVEPLLAKALAKETSDDPSAEVFGATARGVARAASWLARQYTLVVTNVPYLAEGKQHDTLREYCKKHHPDAKTDLATAFVERCEAFVCDSGTFAVVTPQAWFFLKSYRRLRERLLNQDSWNMVAKLGPAAFQDMNWWNVTTALSVITRSRPGSLQEMSGIDTSDTRVPSEKAQMLNENELYFVPQTDQLKNPDCVIVLEKHSESKLLAEYVTVVYGTKPGQTARITRFFWEIDDFNESRWRLLESTPDGISEYSGKAEIILSAEEVARQNISETSYTGSIAWGKPGIVVSKMNQLPASIYCGQVFDDNTYVLLPNSVDNLEPIYCYVRTDIYRGEVRKRNQKVAIDTSSMINTPFDLDHWQKVAREQYPGGLPEPNSVDPTQWLFKGQPRGSTMPLHVAVARLLGYRWPEQQTRDELESVADADGIVPLPAVGGEQPAAARLRMLLASAYGTDWSVDVQDRLLAEIGYAGKSLEEWLRDGFFVQHCRLFRNRPFLWHIWDGRRDGFAAIVNYHRLDRAKLERLIYTYLGNWITAQRAARDTGDATAEGRLVAALALQKKLEDIRTGEPPYDIYVRWKPLHQQSIGWEPDLNDGVRLNIRPFVEAGVLRAKFTIHWNKDRGTNPDGSERINNVHLTLDQKRKAGAEAGA